MKDFVEQLSLIVPAISIGFVIIITSINFYTKIRRRFPVTVNCWFCNQNTKVSYTDWNSWHCPSCEQYNGFTEDGDYNCDIPAQRLSKFNKAASSSASVTSASVIDGDLNASMAIKSNGFCEYCNRNQELKMQQLASFVPANESDFDEEVEEFRQQLEQAYRLCPRCERQLKRTLNRVKNNILGSKLAQIGSKGLHALDHHVTNAASRLNTHRKRQYLANICLSGLLILACIAFYRTGKNTNITKAKLDTVFNPSWTATILMAMSYLSAMKILLTKFVSYVHSLPFISQSVLGLKLLTTYLYLMISGNFFEYVKEGVLRNAGFISQAVLFGPEPEHSAHSLNNTSIVLNAAGCLLSTSVILLVGLKPGPLLSMLLWSVDMIILSSLPQTIPLRTEFFGDVLKMSITLSVLIISTWNLLSKPAVPAASNRPNSSFHRIYSECNSDISDESEAETELNTSQQSNFSSRSVYSNKSPRAVKNLLNTSNHSISPSDFSSGMQKEHISASTMSLNLQRPTSDLNRSFTRGETCGRLPHFNGSQDNLFDNRQSCASVYSSVSGPVRQPSFIWSDSFTPIDTTRSVFAASPIPDSASNMNAAPQVDTFSFPSRCASRNSCYEVPDDFQSGITQLSIGTTRKHFEYAKSINPSFFEVPEKRPLLPPELRQRNLLVHPSKLHYNENQQRAMAAHQTSWVAGGYWNNGNSPQKRSSFQQRPMAVQMKSVFPVISRTSSQSSGFESQSSSLKNGHENHSNDNSICDEIERESVFSEPVYYPQPHLLGNGGWSNGTLLAGCMSNVQSPPSTMSPGHYQPQFSQPIFPSLSETSPTFLQPQTSFHFGSNRAKSFSSASLDVPLESSLSFGSQPLPSPRFTSNDKNNSVGHQNLVSSSSFNFNKFNKNLPTFKRGSLIRINSEGANSNLTNIGENGRMNS